jgi:peptidyl-prolyl cis-trans isomerase C
MIFARTIPLATALLLPLAAPVLAESHVAADQAVEEAATPTADTVVATVNGTEITLGHMIVMRQNLPQQFQQLPPDVLFNGILEQLVQQTLLGQQVSDLSAASRMSLANEERALRASEELRRVVGDAVTDEAIQQAYDETYGNAEQETEYNASHILVETEDEAKDIRAQLEDGADFAELAQKSIDPSGPPRGGSLGWFGKGAMVEAFETAVTALEVGQISDPVQTQFGWHVIKLNETRLKDAPTFEEVRGQLLEDLQRKAIEARIAELTEGADITQVSIDDYDPTILNDPSLLGE